MPEILKIVADNRELFNALKDGLEAEFSLDKIDTNMRNELIGEVMRSRIKGMEKVEKFFKKVELLRTLSDKPAGQNPAR